jgi:hypothetical protein
MNVSIKCVPKWACSAMIRGEASRKPNINSIGQPYMFAHDRWERGGVRLFFCRAVSGGFA